MVCYTLTIVKINTQHTQRKEIAMRNKKIEIKFLTENYATEADLKRAFRKLSKKLHPDNGGKTEDFQQLSAEYDYLEQRFEADRKRKAEEAARKAAAEERAKKRAAEEAARKAARKAAEEAKKKEKPAGDKFDRILASIPLLGDMVCRPNSKRTAVHVLYKGKRVFGHSGPILVVTREELLEGITGAEKKNYGWRVPVSEENMKTLQRNAKNLWG